jgi:hypothetical protein
MHFIKSLLTLMALEAGIVLAQGPVGGVSHVIGKLRDLATLIDLVFRIRPVKRITKYAPREQPMALSRQLVTEPVVYVEAAL